MLALVALSAAAPNLHVAAYKDDVNVIKDQLALGVDVNLKSDEGKEVFFKLVEQSDVIVENYRSAVKHRLGIDYEPCAKVNPRIVYASIAGFGQDGPYGKRPGVDQIAQGLGGLMSVTGMPGQGPVRVGIPICDLTAGMFLAQAVLIALLDREVTGEGQWVHTSLLEAMIQMMDFQASRYLVKGDVPKQAGNNHPTSIPTGVFETVGPTALDASDRQLIEELRSARPVVASEPSRVPVRDTPRPLTAPPVPGAGLQKCLWMRSWCFCGVSVVFQCSDKLILRLHCSRRKAFL